MSDVAEAEIAPWEREDAAYPPVKQAVKDLAAGIFSRICAGTYSSGTRLPAERELAETFSESRNTVRQALEFLEGFDVVSRRAGSGPVVSYRASAKRAPEPTEADPGIINISKVAETVSPFDMNIALSILEPEIVRLATIYMSMSELAVLEDLINEMEKIVSDADRFAQLEKEFMMQLCRGTHNAVIVCMYGILYQVSKQPQWCAIKKRSLTPERIRQSQQALRSMFTALERRNVDTAVQCMRLYLASSQEDMLYTGG